jgi:alpha-tubulin suppressor-like RCC1 family protein
MPRGQGGTLSGFKPLSTPNAPTDLSVSTSIGSASVSFTAPSDTGDAEITSYIVTTVDESTGVSSGFTGTESPISFSSGGGTFSIRMQAVNAFGPGRLTEFDTGNQIYTGAELYAWGEGSNGRLGDNTVVSKSSPVQVGALQTWSQVASGSQYHSAAIKTDGTFWMWGRNFTGQIGDGTTITRSSPVQVGALTNWSQPAVGGGHMLAVKTDNSLWAWGNNASGQLGQNIAGNTSSPVQVGILTNWAQVTAGSDHSIAVKTSGTLWSWGFNHIGQLGQNIATTINRSSPVQIGSLTNWSRVSEFYQSASAIKTDGTLWSWGLNAFGMIGDGTVVRRSSPVQVGAFTTWSDVAKGTHHTVAVTVNGALWSWGSGQYGQIGANNTIFRSLPIQVGTLTNWSQISAGFSHSLSAKTDGTLWAWGDSNAGRLGDGTVTRRSSPVQIGAASTWVKVAGGLQHSFALLGV